MFIRRILEEQDAACGFGVSIGSSSQLAFSDLERMAQTIATQPNIVSALMTAKNSSAQPDAQELQVISDYLQRNVEAGDGLFENIFLMYNNVAVADGIGGGSLGWENEEAGGAEPMLLRSPRLSPTTGRPVMTIVAPIYLQSDHLGTAGLCSIIKKSKQSGQIPRRRR